MRLAGPFIRQPTLILAGDDPPIVRLVNARIIAQLVPRAQLEVYQDGHLALLTPRLRVRRDGRSAADSLQAVCPRPTRYFPLGAGAPNVLDRNATLLERHCHDER